MNNINIENIIKRFREMRLPIMAEELLNLVETGTIEVLERLSSEEYISRKNNTINRLKKRAKLSQAGARLEEIDYSPERQINRSVIEQLMTNNYIRDHRNVVLLGACGTGKSYISNALGNHACESSYTTYYCRIFEFLSECHQEYDLTQTITRVIKKYSKYDVLIIDDFLMTSVQEREAQNIFQLLEYRYGNIIADSILDRIIPNAYELVLYGESNRK